MKILIAGGAGYPLRPLSFGFVDFTIADVLPASAMSYVLLQPGTAGKDLSVSFSGAHGMTFASDARPQLAIMRLR